MKTIKQHRKFNKKCEKRQEKARITYSMIVKKTLTHAQFIDLFKMDMEPAQKMHLISSAHQIA